MIRRSATNLNNSSRISRESKSGVKVAACCLLLVFAGILGCSIYMAVAANHIGEATDVNIRRVTQVEKDWRTVPFVTAVTRDEECKYNEEPIFMRLFEGAEMGCIVYDWGS